MHDRRAWSILILLFSSIFIFSVFKNRILFYFVKTNHVFAAKVFLLIGADPNFQNKTKFSLPCLAALNKSIKMMDVLSDAGLNADYIDVRNGSGMHPLLCFSVSRFSKGADVILKSTKNVDVFDDYGFTPLMLSAHLGDAETLKLLLERGANPNYIPKGGAPPLVSGIASKKKNVVQLLLDHGARVDFGIGGEGGFSPLHAAVKIRNMGIVKLLIRHGANPNLKSSVSGDSPLEFAKRANKNRHSGEIYKYLLTVSNVEKTIRVKPIEPKNQK